MMWAVFLEKCCTVTVGLMTAEADSSKAFISIKCSHHKVEVRFLFRTIY